MLTKTIKKLFLPTLGLSFFAPLIFTPSLLAADLIEFEANTPARASEVNDNFNALNDDTQTNAGNIAINATDIGSNQTAIADNSAEIASQAVNINTNTTGIADNAANITTNTSSISNNTSGVNANASAISINTNTINANRSDIDNNSTNIEANIAAIASNLALINDNASGIDSNFTALNNLQTQVDSITAIGVPAPSSAPNNLVVDCDAGNLLQDTINLAPVGFTNIFVTGTCNENIVMERDGIRLFGNPTATITGTGTGTGLIVDGAQNYLLFNINVTTTDHNAVDVRDYASGVLVNSSISATSSVGNVTALNLGSSGRTVTQDVTISANSSNNNASGVIVGSGGVFFSVSNLTLTSTANNGIAQGLSVTGNSSAGAVGANISYTADGQGLANGTSFALNVSVGGTFNVINIPGQTVTINGDMQVNDGTLILTQANVTGLDLIANRSTLVIGGNENVFTGLGDNYKVDATGSDVAINSAGTLDFNIDIDNGSSLFMADTTLTGEILVANTSAIETATDAVISGNFSVALNSSALFRENTQITTLDLVFGSRAALNDTATITTATQTESYACMLLVQDAASVTTAPGVCP